jgi:hypothetical protein
LNSSERRKKKHNMAAGYRYDISREEMLRLAPGGDGVLVVCAPGILRRLLVGTDTAQDIGRLVREGGIRALEFTACDFEIGTLHVIVEAIKAVAQVHRVEWVEFWDCPMTSDNWTALMNLIAANTPIKNIGINYGPVDGVRDETWLPELGAALRQNETLEG